MIITNRVCPNCTTSLQGDVIFASDVDKAISQDDWWGKKANTARTVVINGQRYSVDTIEAKLADGNERNQGDTAVVYEIVRIVRTGAMYFKKTGTESSYGETSWDGPCVRVEPKQITVSSFEELA